jgi:hypothetical protein
VTARVSIVLGASEPYALLCDCGAVAEWATLSDAAAGVAAHRCGAPASTGYVCPVCGDVFVLRPGTTLTRGSRPCGWSH